ncbi:MAG: hypothetical protein IPK28_10730 [Devosia sp.]|nr:hypothetical protein [Devosia sp.]
MHLDGLGVTLSASAGTDYLAKGQQATNTDEGATAAALTYAKVVAGTGGVSLTATDTTQLLVWRRRPSATPIPMRWSSGSFCPELRIENAYAANLVDRSVSAVLDHVEINANGDVEVVATRALIVAAFGESASILTSNSFFDTMIFTAAGSLVLNAVEGDVSATVSNSDITTTVAGGLSVSAAENSQVDGRSEAQARTEGGNGGAAGGSVALTVLGWSTDTLLSRVLTATLDTLMGTSFWTTSNPIEIEARIVASSVDVVGALSVVAVAATQDQCDRQQHHTQTTPTRRLARRRRRFGHYPGAKASTSVDQRIYRQHGAADATVVVEARRCGQMTLPRSIPTPGSSAIPHPSPMEERASSTT